MQEGNSQEISQERSDHMILGYKAEFLLPNMISLSCDRLEG